MRPDFSRPVYTEAPLCRECRFRYAHGEVRDGKGRLVKWCRRFGVGTMVKETQNCDYFRKES